MRIPKCRLAGPLSSLREAFARAGRPRHYDDGYRRFPAAGLEARSFGLLSVIAAAIAMSPAPAAAAATSGGVTITLACEIGAVGTGTFKITANGSSTLTTVPCGGSATA